MTLNNPKDAMLVFRQPKSYIFDPQTDITPIEAVWIAHLFAFTIKSNLAIDLSPQWEIIKRHFRETPGL